MAKKQFEIQGSTLRIGGVDLTAGASSVVIPGVTQASTFIPEEVEKYGDDESTWADVPVIIDQYTYAVLLSQQTPPQGWSAPTYLAELDGDKIDEIEIISPGAGITELIATVMSDNIMAAPAGSSIDLETFDINVWVAINWSVKCEVGEIENVGGGGNANTGSITFEGNMIIGAGEDSGDGNGYNTIRLVPDYSLGENSQYIVIDPTAPNHIHIRAGGEQDNSPALLILGGEKNNVSIEDNNGVTISNEQTFDTYNYYNAGPDFIECTWFEESGSYYVQFTTENPTMVSDFWTFTNGAPNALKIYDSQGQYTLTYGGSGSNTVANVYKVQVVETPIVDFVATALEFQIFTTNSNEMYLRNNDFRVDVKDDVRILSSDIFRLVNRSTESPIEITTNDNETSNTWYFGSDGNMFLPRNTFNNSVAYLKSPDGDTSVKLSLNGGNGVEIIADVYGSATTAWQFGTNGVLTLPVGGVIHDSNGINIISSEEDTLDTVTDRNATTTNAITVGSLSFNNGGTIRVVGVPTTSTGAIGDVAGDVAFNGTHMYYCTANFPTTYNATLYGGYSGNAYPSLAKGEYPQPQPGWTFVWNLVTYTIVDVTDPNPGEWSLQVDQTIDTLSGGTITLITPGGSIWKRVAWGVDTW